MTRNIVLGAGIAGVTAGYTAQQAGHEAIVYKAASRAGGLLVIDDLRSDTVVHLSFVSEAEVRGVSIALLIIPTPPARFTGMQPVG